MNTREYFESGELMVELVHLSDDQQIKKMYFKSGALLAEIEYVRGEPTRFVEWDESGVLRMRGSKIGDKLHGKFQSWWRTGVKKEDGSYDQGRRLPGYRWFTEDGLISSEIE